MLTHTSSLSPPERIDRCVQKLAAYPEALDILLISLRKVHDQPTVERFRKVPLDHPRFKETVGAAPGGTELLFAVGYEPMFSHLVLQKLDSSLLRRAIQNLEQAQTGSVYLAAKTRAQEEHAIRTKVAQEAETERKRREAFADLVPKEPVPSSTGSTTSCAVVSIHGADDAKVAQRRFDSEHTLRDLLNYVRSLPSTPNGPFRLDNVTQGTSTLDLDACLDRSLFSLDLWPVSHVRVVPMPVVRAAA